MHAHLTMPARHAATPLKFLTRLALASLPALALVACGPGGSAPGGAGPGGQMPPPPQVGVVTVQATGVSLPTELPGRLEAKRVAQVRARVTGVVNKRLFTEGALVKAGQSLFQIDAAPYQATLASAKAQSAKAEAALAQAQAQLARLNVAYAAVASPISGRIGRAMVTEGALVSQAEGTLLATVQQVDSLYVNFTQSAAEVMRLKRAVEAGKLRSSGSTQVRIVLDDGTEYAQPGKLLFSDLSVDPSSGQVTLRAEVPNPNGDLLPGLYVKVRLNQVATDNAMLVPQQAVTRAAAGDTVLVVGADGQVAPRPVQLGGARGTQWVVLGGLKAGEQVVVDGFQKIRPKSPVTPVPWSPLGASAPTAGPGASPPASAASR